MANTELLPELLARKIESYRADLMRRYQQALRQTLFTNRTQIRPTMLGKLAEAEVEALFNFFNQTLSGKAHGNHLGHIGLSDQTVLRLNQATRRFFITHLDGDMLIPALDLIDAHQNEVVHGFIEGQAKLIYDEQERMRSALQVAVSRYMVEIKEIEALAQQATEASNFKTQFIARISHELRTPLGALLGIAEMLQHEVYGPLTLQQHDLTQRIINNARVLEHVFSELLDQSQIEAGQLHLHSENFSPQALIDTVYANYLPLALQKGLAMRLKNDPNLPATVQGDAARIEQVVSNLITNAIKFTEIGSIVIRSRMANETQWAIQIKDTGIGISEKDQNHIFESFRQADETSGRKFGGVGLGLAIVHNLVTAMGGKVTVKSKVGHGSTFTVLLPLQIGG
ncbi:MAG: hypothetical protein KDJ65_32985 [Anaerolineae bacterium]|nr:hypothetical protein [Anaerolineae bacterium]